MSRREIVDLQLNNRFRSTSTLCAMDAMVARIKEKHYIAAMWLTKSCYGGELSQPLGRFEVNLSRIGRANEVRPEDAAVDDAVLVDYFDVRLFRRPGRTGRLATYSDVTNTGFVLKASYVQDKSAAS